ncbi:MAG: hypothetical protein ABIR71_07350 [Chthoniobacterales bacterium]
MPEEPPPDKSPQPPSQPRRRMLTPEQRRFLGTPRPRGEDSDLPLEPEPPAAPPIELPPETPRPEPKAPQVEDELEREEETETEEPDEPEKRSKGGTLRLDQKASRVPEMQRAILIIGALVLIGLTFFVGMKFPYWRYKVMSARNTPDLKGTVANKFPGVSKDQLIADGLRLEREGKFNEAAERLLAAKHQDLGYRGILARVGKIAYDHKDFKTADQLFERAIAFGENVDNANYFRGLIAVRYKDLPAALRFFEAATVAEPFVADYHFYLGEALRLNHHPRDAIPRYEHAALLAPNDQQADICRFKIRMALLEAADADKVKVQLEAQKSAGKLSVDWLMTAAAIDLREGRLDEAIPLILLAHDSGEPDLFAACITDAYFVEAAHKHPRVAEVSRLPAG